jgi:acetyl-CoA acetyltransferase
MTSLRNKAAVVGIGATEFSKCSGRSEMRLAVEAVSSALADAGLSACDVDGMASYSADNNLETEIFRNLGGRDLKFFARVAYGGGAACAPLLLAAMAVSSGVADVVVCYRAMNERSEYRFGRPFAGSAPTSEGAMIDYHAMHGLQTAAAMMAVATRRYMHGTGTRAEDFALVSIAARKHAATNPNAFFYQKPITLDDYMQSRLIADPLRLLDCCQESDGAVAVVVTSAARARMLRQRPVYIAAAAQSSPWGTMGMTGFYRDDITYTPEVRLVAEQLYAMADLRPADIDVAILYDHFGPSVLPSLEAFAFCERGEAKDFIKDGAIEIGGRLPVNTHGGQLGEAYIHGMNGITEAVRQLRGTAVNQVADARHVVVTGGSGNPMSGVILARD